MRAEIEVFKVGSMLRLAIVGSAGIPANYGGFETLVENIVKYHSSEELTAEVVVYCSSKSLPVRSTQYLQAHLKYIPFAANGPQSVLYDIASLFWAVKDGADVILLLGVSGASAIPILRFFSRVSVVTNVDGIEWRREKWRGFSRLFLRLSECFALKFSNRIVADNEAIASYLLGTYGVQSELIAYGGDHAVAVDSVPLGIAGIPSSYSLCICRIEPENNVHMSLEAFSKVHNSSLVVVGNWNNSRYGINLRETYKSFSNIRLLDPIYNLGKLKSLREHAEAYVHGHSAGGTNPSLVEAMHFGIPIFAYDCDFNRATTENRAYYFKDADALREYLINRAKETDRQVGKKMQEIAVRRYSWRNVAKQYFDLLEHEARHEL